MSGSKTNSFGALLVCNDGFAQLSGDRLIGRTCGFIGQVSDGEGESGQSGKKWR